MKPLIRFFVMCVLVLALVSVAGAQWKCLYATWDDYTNLVNAIGTQTASVGVIKGDMFVALASAWSGTPLTNSECFLLPYVDADSGKGRKYGYGYGTDVTGIFQTWTDGGFDQVSMYEAWKIKATPDSLIYVANNDLDHNVLVFKYTQDTVTVVPVAGTGVYPRQQTGTKRIHGIDVDVLGYVYVCNDSSLGVTDDIKIYKPVKQWTASHTDAPVSTVNLPDGVYKGISVSPDGKLLFVADYGNRRILKYRGSPTSGYTPDAGFSFTMSPADTISSTVLPAPLGLAYLTPNNILAVACHVINAGSAGYRYGRIYMLNPNNGAFISPDTLVYRIDAAKWNFDKIGVYNNRVSGMTPGNASGYCSPYDVKWDGNKNLYTVSWYGWTVDKWAFEGTLPTITLTGVEEIGGTLPGDFTLEQNYPNPFNPTTSIEFGMPHAGEVSLKVYSVLGQEVATLVHGMQAPGVYRVTFNAQGLASGTYFSILRAEGTTIVKRMMLVR
jgi:hypothetical protein